MAEFKPNPALVLESMEDVRETIAQPRNGCFGLSNADAFNVKSLWIIALIDEIAAQGQYPYNATVKKLAEQRLGLPPKPEAEYSREGDVLSLLIYNAQCFRRSDELIASGFVPFTESVLKQAYAEKRAIQCGSKVLKVREKGGKLYAMEARKRSHYMAPMGQPVRLAEAGQESNT